MVVTCEIGRVEFPSAYIWARFAPVNSRMGSTSYPFRGGIYPPMRDLYKVRGSRNVALPRGAQSGAIRRNRGIRRFGQAREGGDLTRLVGRVRRGAEGEEAGAESGVLSARA